MLVPYASPHIALDEWRSGRRSDIDVFEDQLRTWLFEQADALSSGEHAGPAILALITPYFEAIACYRAGKSSRGNETQYLRDGIVLVFPHLTKPVVDLYVSEVRHGFAHEAVFRSVVLHRGHPNMPPLGLLPGGLLSVDPWWLLGQLKAHFASYVATLRTGSDVQVIDAFEAFMKVRKQR